MIIKETNKHQARKLRGKGKSYTEILKIIKVSKSTLSIWLRDIPLSQKQILELKGRCKSRFIASKTRQKTRIKETKEIITKAKAEIKNNINNPLFLSGVFLYWAEGTKRGEEIINFSNSDSQMIRLMMRWFRKVCAVPENKFRIQLHIHSLHDRNKLLEHWSKITKVPTSQFHKVIIKKTSLSHRKNILYNGTCCIRINDRKLFRRMMGWKSGLLKQFGIKDDYQIPK